jgi:hypothetical protein
MIWFLLAVMHLQGVAAFSSACHGKAAASRVGITQVWRETHRRDWILIQKGLAVDWYKSVFELIDMRSFSNLWYWIVLAVLWSTTSHWVIGVPFDLITRARKHGGDAAIDLHDLVGINTRRLLYIARMSGLWLIGFAAFFFTTLAVLGFVYGAEFAQALFLLMAPMVLVFTLSLSTAQHIATQEMEGDALYRRLIRHRMTVQAIGMVSIFITSLWGMWQNMQVFNIWSQ